MTDRRAGELVAGRYRLERRLGRGGMGEVWAAVHTVTEQRRALKLVDEDDVGTRKRMLREARAASAVRHPNVVAVHDVVEASDGTPVLVMDLLEGETLESKIEREGRIGVVETIRIVTGIASGLEAAHALGIVHRDLKPANVFLTPEVKVLDFGVAKLTAETGPARATNLLTESGAMVGTPCYMAPEQAFGDGDVDARTDLWALGVVLYECLSGVRPADGTTVGQVFKILATGAIVPLATRAPDVPRGLTDLVDELLSTRPDDRPATVAVVRDRLASLDLTAEAAPTTIPPRPATSPAVETTDATAVLPPPTSRPRRPLTLLALTVPLLLAATLAARLYLSPTPANAPANANANATTNANAPANANANALPLPLPTSPPPPPAVADAGPPRPTAPPGPRTKPAPAPAPAPVPSPSSPSPPASPSSKLLTEPPF